MSVRQSLATKRKNARIVTITLDDDNEHRESSPVAKRQKVVAEKRLRRFRSSMTIAIHDRIERALHQRLYLLTANKSSNHREYQVLGQTGNVYTIIISHLPSCTCPDYGKGYLCKHILFVLHRVLKVRRHSPLLYQQALLTSELNDIFTHADSQVHDSSILPEQSIREGYQSETGHADVMPNKKNTVQQKAITKDDECPICFESMIDDQTMILFCSQSCGNNMHKTCFQKWQQAKISMNESVTCPFCRIEWKINTNKPITTHGYLNLAAYSTTDDYDQENEDPLFFNYW